MKVCIDETLDLAGCFVGSDWDPDDCVVCDPEDECSGRVHFFVFFDDGVEGGEGGVFCDEEAVAGCVWVWACWGPAVEWQHEEEAVVVLFVVECVVCLFCKHREVLFVLEW